MTRRIEAVLFDLGRVLVDWDPRYLYKDLFADAAEMERFLAEVCTMAWHGAHDAGTPMAVNAAPLIAEHPHYEPHIRAWETRWHDMFAGPIHGAVDVLEALHGEGVPLYALSNLPAEKKTHIFETFGFMDRFQDVIVSGEEGVIKPEPRIYEIALARMGRPAEAVFFVDDSAANVEAARRLGFDAHRFDGARGLKDAVAARNLASPAALERVRT
jgi:HAD superfamily hydrolase (TIGR01509 family)